MVVVDLLAIVLGKCFEAFATEEENANFRQLFARRDIASLFEQLLELLLPSTKS